MDPHALSGNERHSLPIGMYESIYDTHHDIPRLVFVKTSYKIETIEAERIAVDHVAKPDISSTQSSLGSSCNDNNNNIYKINDIYVMCLFFFLSLLKKSITYIDVLIHIYVSIIILTI